MVFGMLALTVAALFAGAALYVSFVEHPARAELDDRAQLEQWKPAYARGAVMQASLALIGFVLGTIGVVVVARLALARRRRSCSPPGLTRCC